MSDASSQQGASVTSIKGYGGGSGGSGSGSGGATPGGGSPPPADGGVVLRLVETLVIASEDRVMRQVVETTGNLEKELSRQMSDVVRTVHAFKPGATWWQNLIVVATVVVTGIGIVFAVLAYASDRFDSGLSSMGAVEEALDAQREINSAQDQRLDRILGALEAQHDQPQPSPKAPEAP